jgi:hypothetical protein
VHKALGLIPALLQEEKFKKKKKKKGDLGTVAHTYNLNYSEGRDQEDHSSKPAQTVP